MRFLSGAKHQLGDIAPGAASPVNAFFDAKTLKVSLVAKRWEFPRLLNEFSDCHLNETVPNVASGLYPDNPEYSKVLDEIVRPVSPEALAEIQFLSRRSMLVLARCAFLVRIGMNGLELRGLVLHELSKESIDANLVLIAVSGQESFLHPIASASYRVEYDKYVKLVIGARYKEHIVSQTLMFKVGGTISKQDQIIYHALQDAAVEYSDCFREGVKESEIYGEMLCRFKQIEEDCQLQGFAKSATKHHPGGGTSPLGNRDRMIEPRGVRECVANTMFAINPVDSLADFKVEIQGVIRSGKKSPIILDMASEAKSMIPFRTIQSKNGTIAVLPELFVVECEKYQ